MKKGKTGVKTCYLNLESYGLKLKIRNPNPKEQK